MLERNKYERYAYQRGYRCDGKGGILGIRFKHPLKLQKRNNYYVFNMQIEDEIVHVSAHRFIAYCKYGEEIYNHEVVRHLDDITSNNHPDNLALGTSKQNTGDRSRDNILRHIKKIVNNRTFFTKEQVEEIIAMRNYFSVIEICKIMGCSQKPIYRILNGTYVPKEI